jgi:NAD/NADP transhydrogenase beta subunit
LPALSSAALIGAAAARLVQMTSMPEMVALFNGFGGLASLLVGAPLSAPMAHFTLITIVLSILIGGVTFTGSLVAWGKLSETINSGAVRSAASRWSTASSCSRFSSAAGCSACIRTIATVAV